MKLLTRPQVASLLSFEDYVAGVEQAFRLHADGRSLAPRLMHVDAPDGEFHVKGGGLWLDGWYFALKANGSFFGNPARHGLPAIQGAILLFDAEQGSPLALLDSGEITIQRTGAATAVAARLLARPDSSVVTICGCGRQGRVQLKALAHVLPLTRAFVWDVNPDAARALASAAPPRAGLAVEAVTDLEAAVRGSDAVATCTPSRAPFIRRAWLRPGTFVAAVGADSPGKQELDADVLAPPAVVVVDLLEQAAHVGELQHALGAGLMTEGAVRGELGEIIAGRRPARTSDDEVIIFDATGTALQDVVAAVAAYRRAVETGAGTEIDLLKG
jgi:ornithine cyclodeaminase/alanine dehydrogenase